MLYDTTADVIRKALRGLDLAPSAAAARSGLSVREVTAASRGPADSGILRKLAGPLGLDGAALAELPDYSPPPCDLPHITRLELPFDDETVNCWLIRTGLDSESLLFDTGAGFADVSRALDGLGVRAVHVLITHDHGDHTGGLETLRKAALSIYGPDTALQPGQQLAFGALSVTAIGLPGHCPGALGYLVEGLPRPICITGDALFAGSIGGCAPGEPYQTALAAIRDGILTLADDTILLPGHGPETTVGAEAQANPFFANDASRG